MSILDITTKCNLNCVYCCRGYTKKGSQEPCYQDIIYAAKQIILTRGDLLVLQGGEPLIREDFAGILTEIGKMRIGDGINKKQMKCFLDEKLSGGSFKLSYLKMLITNGLPMICITSNGMFYSEEIKNALKQVNAYLEISLDSIDEDLNKKVRIGIDFDHVCRNIEKYAEEVPVEISCTVTEDNVDRITEMLDFVKKTGCIGLKINPVIMVGRRKEDSSKWENSYISSVERLLEEHETKFKEILLKIKLLPYMIELPDGRKLYEKLLVSTNVLLETHKCQAFQTIKDVYIDTDLNVYGCASMRGCSELILGNLKEESLRNMWQAPKRTELLYKIERYKNDSSSYGGCTAACYQMMKGES